VALVKTLPDTGERVQQELLLQAALGPALAATKGLADPEVGKAYTRARELCREVGESPQLFPVLRGLTMFYSARADHKTTRELAELHLSLAQLEQDPILLLGAHLELGSALFYQGEFMEGWKHLEKGVVLYDPQKHNSHVLLYGYNLGISCFARSATVLWLLGYPDQALKRSQQALTMAQQQPHRFSLAYALCFSAECHRLRREERTTQEQAEAAIRLSVEQGFPLWMAGATIYKGWALAEQGQYKEGISLMSEGIATWQATGAEVARPAWLAQLAEGYGQAGQVVEGLSTITEGLNAANTREERWWEAELYRLQGELMLRQERQKAKGKRQRAKVAKPKSQILEPQSEAEACFLKAVTIAQRQQAKSLELRATMSLARLWQRQEKLAEARKVLSKVYNWFTEGFDTTDLQEAKALLHELRMNNVVRDGLSAQSTH